MKKSKLFGTKLLEDIDYPKIPSVIMLDKYESLPSIKFEKGDLLDANSIKMYIRYLSGLENVITFNDLATDNKPGIVQCGDNITIQNGIIDINSISDKFINDLK